MISALSGSVRKSRSQCHFGEQLGDERPSRLASLRDLDPQLTLGRLQPPRAKPVAQPALALRPALIASPAPPRIELLLDRPLNDQPSAESRELRQHLLRVIDHPLRHQLVDTRLYLRRRRYGASHGVGLLHRLPGLQGTYAVVLTAPARPFTAALRRDPPARVAPCAERRARVTDAHRSPATSPRPPASESRKVCRTVDGAGFA